MIRDSSSHQLRLVVALLATATCGFAQAGGYNNQAAPPPMQQGAPMQPGSMPPGGMPPAELPRPGSVNYVQGEVSAEGQPLTLQSVGHFALQPGQPLDTGNGYVEVLLTPGAFLRVGPGSEFRMTAVGLQDTRVNLLKGSALVEVDQFVAGTHLEVTLASTSVDLLKKGLYGFTANPPMDVRVFDGKADVVGMSQHTDVGKHDQILLADNPSLKKSHFDEDQAKQDPLYVWSAARSRAESDQNKLVAKDYTGYYPVGDGWFWDPYANYYGFWGPGFFNSPFGFGFYGGFYPGFYHGYYGGFHSNGFRGGHAFVGVHGNGVAGGFHGGGFHGGGFHGGGGRR